MLQDLRLTIVVENSASLNNPYLLAQHGLCIFLELDLGTDKIKVLMDSGTTSEVTLHNADLLNLNLREIDLIVLSHGHYDHTGGLMGILKRMNQKVPVLAHPEIFTPKMKAQPFLKYIGPPFCRAEAEAAGAIMLESSVPVVLASGVMTTGEIVSKEPFEETNGFWTIKEGQYSPDTIPDDQALIVNIPGKGLVVVAGCAHSGIINTIEHAQKITGIEKLYAVIGGFHLMNAGKERIDSTAEALVRLDPEVVRPGHCTGQKAVCRLQGALGDICQPLAVGDSINL